MHNTAFVGDHVNSQSVNVREMCLVRGHLMLQAPWLSRRRPQTFRATDAGETSPDRCGL